jgi:hypothetical protein
MSNEIDHHGYRLSVKPHGAEGWKVFIYPPHAVVALDKIPHKIGRDSRDAVVEEARRAADQDAKLRSPYRAR